LPSKKFAFVPVPWVVQELSVHVAMDAWLKYLLDEPARSAFFVNASMSAL